ncbi:MAG: efflux RND transporter permease subunit [Bacteroidaceae bacterium]|nr:efflux RND transporter permease subunit [Bacteroidaceae bacterium]MBR0045809.1 efflux RND transporter permease subunit [Bacteroidaceae bacterium]
MARKMSWLNWPLKHYSISLLIVAILFILGIYGMYVMPKDEFPAFTIRQGVVIAVYPGATSEEIEEQVAKPLERYLFTYEEVRREKTTTTSQNGMCIVMVHLNDDVNNKDEVWSKIKHGLNAFKSQLPSGVLGIVVNDDFGNTSALLIAIESPERSYRELKQYSGDLSDRLRRTHAVRKAKIQRLQAENDRMEAREKLSIDIQSAWNNLQEAYKQIDIARSSVASSKENLRMQRIFYGAGTTTMTDLLDAITLFTQSESQFVTACATYQLRVAEYKRKT